MFSVRWSPGALSDLADLWTDANSESRRQITDSAREIDLVLERDPLSAGESREVGYRVLLVAPLGIEFLVDESRGLAHVYRVWNFKSRR